MLDKHSFNAHKYNCKNVTGLVDLDVFNFKEIVLVHLLKLAFRSIPRRSIEHICATNVVTPVSFRSRFDRRVPPHLTVAEFS